MEEQAVNPIKADNLQRNGADRSPGGDSGKVEHVGVVQRGVFKKGQVVHWAKKGSLAVLDQALFAGTNFLVSILLARWLEPAAYGAFSVAYSIFLLLGTLHTALWTEPMMVYGSGRFREAFVAYQRVLIGYHWRFGVVLALGFLLAATGFGAAGQREMALSFLGLAFAAPTVLYLWLVRRGAYVLLEPRLAAYGGASYLVLYLGLALLLLRASFLNEATAFLAMALAALLAAEGIRLLLKAGADRAVDPGEIRELHWGYGRWALLAGMLSWVPGNFYLLVLPIFSDFRAAGEYKVLSTLIMPVVYFNSSMMQFFLPMLSSRMANKRRTEVLFLFRIQLLLQTLWGAMWGLFLCLLGNQLIATLTGAKYAYDARVFSMLLASSIALGPVTAFSSLLRAANLPNLLSLGWLVSALATVIAGVMLVPRWGLEGAISGSVVVNLLNSVFLAFLSKRGIKWW